MKSGRAPRGPGRFPALAACPGYTFVELVVVSALLLILASAILPLAKVTIQRQREVELHRALREMRVAIDKYKDAADQGLIGGDRSEGGRRGIPARPSRRWSRASAW